MNYFRDNKNNAQLAKAELLNRRNMERFICGMITPTSLGEFIQKVGSDKTLDVNDFITLLRKESFINLDLKFVIGLAQECQYCIDDRKLLESLIKEVPSFDDDFWTEYGTFLCEHYHSLAVILAERVAMDVPVAFRYCVLSKECSTTNKKDVVLAICKAIMKTQKMAFRWSDIERYDLINNSYVTEFYDKLIDMIPTTINEMLEDHGLVAKQITSVTGEVIIGKHIQMPDDDDKIGE